jgi:hypothetical protein
MLPLDEIIKRNADPKSYRLKPLPSIHDKRVRVPFLKTLFRRR